MLTAKFFSIIVIAASLLFGAAGIPPFLYVMYHYGIPSEAFFLSCK